MSIWKSKFYGFLVPFLGILLIILLLIIPQVHNGISKLVIKNIVNSEHIKLENIDVILNTKKIKFKNIELKIFENHISIPIAELYFDIDRFFFKRKTNFSLLVDNALLNNNIIISLTGSGKYNFRNGDLEYAPLISTEKTVNAPHNFSLFSKLHYSNNIFSAKESIIKINNSSIKLDGKIIKNNYKIIAAESKINIEHVPLDFYHIFLPKGHGLYKFFEESIKSGEVETAEISINLPEEFVNLFEDSSKKEIAKNFKPDYLKAHFKIRDLDYKYSPYMPDIISKSIDLNVEGKNVKILLANSEIAETKVIDGSVYFDYLAENFTIYADANTSGNVKGLLRFIDPETLKKMENSNIDLHALTGEAKSKVHIEIPLSEETENKYEIKSQISNLTGKLLHDRITLSKFNLLGNFNGEKAVFSGRGEINNFKSDLSVIVNLNDQENFSHKINANIDLASSGTEITGIKFISGSSKLKFEILGKKDHVTLEAYSNLENLYFQIPTIALNKIIGKKAFFKLDGNLEEGANQNINISLIGDDNLKIKGVISTNGNISSIKFDNVQHLNNDFKAEIITGGKVTLANVSGKLIDLSEANFAKIMKPDNKVAGDVKLHILLDSVKLKNNVILTETMVDLECKNLVCPIAKFNGQMGHNILRAEYKAHKSVPRWEINTNDAGMLFSGLGITNKMKKGQMQLIVNVPVPGASSINNSYTGNFHLNNFEATQNKLLTRIVSFISIPGLVGTLTNQDIHFNSFQGEFKIENGVFIITDSSAMGPYFNFFLKGNVDSNTRKIDLRGQVLPSLYGLNKLMGSLPLIKALFGKRGGIVFTPFSVRETY